MPVNTSSGQLQQATANPFTSFLNGLSSAGTGLSNALNGQPLQATASPTPTNQVPIYLQQPQTSLNQGLNGITPKGVLQTTNQGVAQPLNVAGVTSTGFSQNQGVTQPNALFEGISQSAAPPLGASNSNSLLNSPTSGLQGLSTNVYTDTSILQQDFGTQNQGSFLGLSQDTLGTIGTIGGLAADVGGLFLGFQSLGLAQEQFDFQKDAFNRQYGDQLAITNQEIADRNQRRQNAGQ